MTASIILEQVSIVDECGLDWSPFMKMLLMPRGSFSFPMLSSPDLLQEFMWNTALQDFVTWRNIADF